MHGYKIQINQGRSMRSLKYLPEILMNMVITLYLLTTFLAFFNAFLFLLYSMIRVKVKNRIVLNFVNFVITKFY